MKNAINLTEQLLLCAELVKEARKGKPELYNDVVSLLAFRQRHFSESPLLAALTICQEYADMNAQVWLLGTAVCMIEELENAPQIPGFIQHINSLL